MVRTVVSATPMTWRIAVTGGITTTIIMADPAAAAAGRSITASCACSRWA
jgi:3-keto-L-gulonate-6-phosphate decarboxylase